MINQLILGGAPPCMMLLPQKRIPLRIVHGASWTICAVADGSTNTIEAILRNGMQTWAIHPQA